MRSPVARAPAVSIATFRDDPLYPRIERAVAAILEKSKIVAPVEVLLGMGLLAPDQLEAWRQGRIPYLEQVIDCNLTRLARLQAARAHLAELADSVGREGSPQTLLTFLETLERDFRLADEELGRVRAAAAARG